MNTRLSAEVEDLVTANPEGIVRVEGTYGTYFVLSEDAMRLRQLIQVGIDEADRGEAAPWNSSEIKAAGRERLRERE